MAIGGRELEGVLRWIYFGNAPCLLSSPLARRLTHVHRRRRHYRDLSNAVGGGARRVALRLPSSYVL